MSNCHVDALLKAATQQLSSHTDSPKLDAELLLAHALDENRTYLYSHPKHPVTPAQQKQFTHYLEQRCDGQPIAYLLGKQPFWSLDLQVTPDVLIPRPDTECLVEQTLKRVTQTHAVIADLGTGSGAIALALAIERPDWQIYATDQSTKALCIAKQNAASHQLEQVHFLKGSWCAALPKNQSFDAIVSNPPYIRPDDPHLTQTSLPVEPRSALVADKDGLADIEIIIQQSHPYLKAGGWLLLEHGYDQAPQVRQLLRAAGYVSIQSFRDLQGHERVSGGQKG